ncbi:hypothetical protein [Streptomyces purpureus]|uniref:Uncharacterized protein n=1 Tax=Streptomyces purpureus TaxID=1951 RepID=A0A918H7I2_9ACTN|nr:hypothetical protein [Streptomyces purpureus]GGT42889.1 hypothetical protein GCM10014713_40820 [Streptomyces purpureus]
MRTEHGSFEQKGIPDKWWQDNNPINRFHVEFDEQVRDDIQRALNIRPRYNEQF